ncbi:hyccin [Diorhabda sublineata]|uniref:hyccin n=1 Tax=Diorhabda sublineata TaxID=1163346 RepID=UPI0024E08B85|nr:hyccin [Diorhabda sublineata]
MADNLVLDWLDEFEALTESEIHTYSTEQEHNHEVMIALYHVLSEPQKYKSDHLIDGICQQLLNFYRSGEAHLRRFTIQFIPTLVFLHLSDKSYSAIQTLLVSLYNLEVIDSKGQPRTVSFRIPSIAQSSIYHDSSNLEPAFIAENSLRRWEECNTKLVSWGPLPQVDCLNAQNRQRVVTALIFLYNQQISNVIIQGIEQTCRGISRLVSQGFNNTSESNRSSLASDSSIQTSLRPRIPVSSPLLVELLHIIYHAAERCAVGAVQALHDVIHRAKYESYAEVLLAANAIKNLLQNSPSISGVTPRPSHTHSVSKSMITNASFRTKKLPDDIPIQDPNQTVLGEAGLDSITEEQEDTEKSKSKGALKHLPKIPGIGKKHKVKNNPQGDQIDSGDAHNENFMNDTNHSVHVSAV